ncbi:unnamed protein product [Schistosoma curassoni]|uniref:Uncharacterized protein n=1 Tax=Schistosoma curassoni TaxID=6186 RepID=A0A183L3I8_9TREM|nr:unnamed protein product [Schistosoma curassoni]
MQEKTTTVAPPSAAVGLNIHKGKSKRLRYNTACINQIILDGGASEDVQTFTYLGSITDEHSGSDADVTARIGKEKAAYLQALTWNPQSQRRRGKSKSILRREMETDMRRMNNNWIELERKAQDRVARRWSTGFVLIGNR